MDGQPAHLIESRRYDSRLRLSSCTTFSRSGCNILDSNSFSYSQDSVVKKNNYKNISTNCQPIFKFAGSTLADRPVLVRKKFGSQVLHNCGSTEHTGNACTFDDSLELINCYLIDLQYILNESKLKSSTVHAGIRTDRYTVGFNPMILTDYQIPPSAFLRSIIVTRQGNKVMKEEYFYSIGQVVRTYFFDSGVVKKVRTSSAIGNQKIQYTEIFIIKCI